MNRINVLLTGIGGPIAQGIIQGLKKRQDIRIIGVDRRGVTAGHHLCDCTYQAPRYTDTEKYLSALQEITEAEKIDVIFPSLHEEVRIFHKHRDAFKPIIALPNSDDFETLMHKEQAYQKLEALGLGKYIPVYRGFNSREELLEIKESLFKEDSHFVVKTVDSYASLGFAILTDRANYLSALKQARKHVIDFDDYCEIIDADARKLAMERIEGKEYSVDVHLYRGQVIVAVPRERTGVSNNIVLDGKVVHHEGLIQASKEITESLVTDGFINIQFMESETGYKLTDINPRFCGSQVMSLGANVNFPSLFIEYFHLGNTVPVEPVWNTRMLRFRDQIFISED
ncbi:ATP-grasp domain-containing protein [Salinicoccus sp. ID82-1]|uniref:ATP-grasp domain-containing protein n=1 Tax=Salinicoccus sp. ID82-1 TaxID=2820269 RepID=UPI001F371E96|nr:ATP-grasp domain-containing protein [Salinicoccus sp. ID82-1]MCG1009861.1 ATP-grasp domain-containing protein [Salinicoccus sp. ID82-1]